MNDFVDVLLAGVPGVVIWAGGQVIAVATFVREKRSSLLGVRLTMVGIAAAIAGSTIVTCVMAVGAGVPRLILALLPIFGPVVAVLLLAASRLRVTPVTDTGGRHG